MQVLSSLSSIPFYAPSAGFAPTNSADVSAIASAYAESAASGKLDKTAQVVTAIGTGWNSDDDGIVSAVNGCILSADEARYAGAANWSNYAFYDRRLNAPGHRLISSLPGSAEVSAIASAYAESAVSSYVPYSSLEYNTASAISGINGSALAAGSTYSAGEGIDITDDVISVETPVDIVAGPGIVIDNPDGNTLRVSTDENYETVLFEGTAATSVTCSEAITNFERLKVYVTPAAVTTDTMIQIVEMVPGKFGSYMMLAGYQSNLFHIYGGRIANSGTTTLKTENGFHMWVPITSGGSVGNESSNSKIAKVVGIHRLANN